MVKKECSKVIEKLKKHIEALSKELEFRLQKAVLFGSYAQNKATEESDIDLIIISKDFKGKNLFEISLLTKKLHEKLIDALDKPFDLLFYSPEEWEKADSPIIRIAKEEGIEIYSEEKNRK